MKIYKNQNGFTLLEYCAGAAAVMVILFGAIRTFGSNVEAFLGQINSRLVAEGKAMN